MEGKSSEKLFDCPVCTSSMRQFFIAKVLQKFDVIYYQCMECGLVKTETPYWTEEAYDSAISNLDVGHVQRNIQLSEKVRIILGTYFNPFGKFLDFAGGYGLFVRLMRDKGFDFYRYDKYCKNIFAEYFNVPSLNGDLEHFELVTAFEVFEHIVDPISELEEIFKLTDSVLLTTELIPADISNVNDWRYFVPETGQHITFYTEKTFRELADKLSVNYYGDGKTLHMLTRKKIDDFSFSIPSRTSFLEKVKKVLIGKFSVSKDKVVRNGSISIKTDSEYIRNKISCE